MLELPTYHWPNLRNLAIGLWQRVEIFMSRVGTIILSLMVILWALSSFPAPPPGRRDRHSIQHRRTYRRVARGAVRAHRLQLADIHRLGAGLAAREVAVARSGTVYALSATGNDMSGALTPLIAQSWSLPTALSLLAWYVFAPQCLSTLATVKRETNSWRYPLIMAAYMFALAYAGSFITYRVALALAALRLEAASQKAGGSCGGCDNCGSAPGATGTKSTTAATGSAAAPSTEIHIPVSTIRRR
jgi:ferrous iron transport protein B